MVTIDEAEAMLDEIAESLPKEFYEELNGGISLLPDVKMHSEGARNGLYTLGEYHRDPAMGRYIVLYFGSFARLYGNLPVPAFYEKLKHTLVHEFTHHMESLAGERSLEIKDEIEMERYRRGLPME